MKTRPKLSFASFFDLIKTTGAAFGEDRIGRHASSLAYYTVFSISPLLLIVISIAALYFGQQKEASEAIIKQIGDNTSPAIAETIADMLKNASGNGGDTARPITATLIALAVALWGASGLFGALQDSLNAIWGVMPDPKLGFLSVVRSRFVSFGMVLGVGFLLLVSLVATTVLAAVAKTMSGAVGDSIIFAQVMTFLLGLGVSMLLFAAIFKVLPDAEIQWHDVWIGAFVTALLFSFGRLALGVYLGRPQVASAYGSAGALIVLLLWVNYASTILFTGAEFTKAYASKFGSKIVPSEGAIPLSPDLRAKQGLSPDLTAKGASGKGAILTSTEVVTANKPSLKASLPAAKKADLEHAISVVAGAVAVLWWVERKRRRESE